MSQTDLLLVWRDVVGFLGYRVSTYGNVESCWQFQGGGYGRPGRFVLSNIWHPLSPDVDERGRRRFTLRRNNKSYKRFAANLVLEAFVGPRPKGLDCCHWDGINSNDRLDNLRWDTKSSNMLDKRRHGTARAGEEHPRAKLTTQKVRQIRKRRARGESLTAIAADVGVTPTMVMYVAQRKNWQHVA